jgi:LuxR family maltose regulon positive regulatory protein
MRSLTSRAEAEAARPPDALIRTKLFIPPLRPDHVPRPRLVARLEAGLTRPLTLLSAPAGFGKTTLLSEWLDHREHGDRPLADDSPLAFLLRPCQAAWLSLDDRDNDPVRFGTYLVAALQTLEYNLDVGRPIVTQSALDGLLADLINEVTDFTDDFALILDDYHVITNPAIHAALTFLIEHMPLQMHLVIVTRADPVGLPLAQLRARDQLLEVRAADLRFRSDEAQAFFNQTMHLHVSGETAAALAERTEGWVAGLQLAALAVAQGAFADGPGPDAGRPGSFNGSHRFIVDYLAEQVLRQQPEAIQRFLLETSILDRLTAPLCEAVMDEGAAGAQLLLEHIERANLFLEPLDDERRWFRYQRLFADFLRSRLRLGAPERLADLHRRAAQWYEANGLMPEAVGHALAVGDTEQAARQIEQIAESIWMAGEMMRLFQWLEALPDGLIRSRPRLDIFHAWILNILGQVEAAEARLRDAEHALAHQAPREDDATLRGMLAATQSILVIMSGDAARAEALAREAQRRLPPDNLIWHCVVSRNLGNAHLLLGDTAQAAAAFEQAFSLSQAAQNTYMALVSLYELGEAQLVQGALRAAGATFRRALKLAEERGTPGLTMNGAIHVGLAAVLREQGQLDEARRHALAGLELGQRGRSVGVQVCGLTRLGLVELARGDAAAAAEAFERAARLAPAAVDRRTSFLAHHDVQAQLWGRRPDLPAALSWVRARGLSAETEPDYFDETGLITLARISIAQGKPREALLVLERARAAAEAAGRIGRVIEMLTLESAALHAVGDLPRASAALARALSLGDREGFWQVFMDEGAPVADLLRRMRSWNGSAGLAQRLLAALGGPADPPPPSPAAHLADPLSEREMDVLRLIAAGLATQEIARQLVVAPSTVQTHIKHLYSKLEVHNRTQAVARARQLGLMN